MGNIHAHSSAPPSPPPPVITPLTPPKDNNQVSDEKSEQIENPGPLEELHQKCKSTF